MTVLRRRTSVLVCALVAAISVAACGAGDDDLEALTCIEEDVPRRFEYRTGGTADPGDIANLSADSNLPGNGATYFSYWKQPAGDPPFDAPEEILCQVTRFPDAQSASDFASEVNESSLNGLLAFAWLPDEIAVTEQGPQRPAEPRVLEIRVDGDLRIVAAIQVVDRYAQTVAHGVASGALTGTVAEDTARKLRERSASLVRDLERD